MAATLLFGLLWGFDWLGGGWKTHFFTTDSTDFIKDLYTTTYHATHDDDLLVCHAMNYPQGEHYTFSGLQPWISMPLQLLRGMGVQNVERAVLPLMNLWIIVGVILCALFLYLLLTRLKLPTWYSVGSALVITLMSPQLQRMGGHISLSYYCVIPMLLYFSVCHMQTLRHGWAVAFGATAFLFGLAHPYYYVFFAVVALFESGWMAWRCHKEEIGWQRCVISFLLQFVLPTALFVIATSVGVPEGERNPVPSGYYNYMATLEGLMLPYSKWYCSNQSRIFGEVGWEGCSYIGLVADIVAIILLISALRALFNRRHRKEFHATGNTEFNLLMAAAVALLVYALGVPLRWLPRNFATYLPSMLLHIRALARLEWLFCYVIGVVASYMLYNWWHQNKQLKRTTIFMLAIIIACTEAVAGNLRNKAWYGYNRWEDWVDYGNRLPQNAWMQHFDADRYQALLCMPGFNIGSELTDISPDHDMYKRCAVISVRTGLPQICNYNSRGVIRQAWDRVALTRTAWNDFDLAEQLPSCRPLLVVASNDSSKLSSTERSLLHEASLIMSFPDVSLYELPISAFKTTTRKTQDDLRSRWKQANTENYVAAPDVSGDIHRKLTLIDSDLLDAGYQELSFWMTPMLTPQYGQCWWWITLSGDGMSDMTQMGWILADSLDAVDTRLNKGMMRFRFNVPQGYSHVKMEVRNRYIKPSVAHFQQIMLRPADIDVATLMGDTLLLNNIPVMPDITVDSYFVAIADGHFTLNGEPWFPLMLNYCADYRDGKIYPKPYYGGDNLKEHFDTIAAWGFNAIRFCPHVEEKDPDTAAIYAAMRNAILIADSAGLRVMLLTHPPFEGWWYDYTVNLMRRLSDMPALWCYDLMNEPLYFDPEPQRRKEETVSIVEGWRKMVRVNAPHQLFTIATAEPIEVFEWDPSVLPIDFIEMHTYHPLRVKAEMWWYSHYCDKPWMIGETGLPVDNEKVRYDDQVRFMRETYDYARSLGAIGYGWWEFQDNPEGYNFEAQYTGLRDARGKRKPAAALVAQLDSGHIISKPELPSNYYNMLAYLNLSVTGSVVDIKGRPIEGAVVRGWNEDWSVGMNTYTDSNGQFHLVSNDVCTHFEVSAPKFSKVKFNKTPSYQTGLNLSDKNREYQSIPMLGWGDATHILPVSAEAFPRKGKHNSDIGKIVLQIIESE
ncbi:MAG: carboxypeptidase regulatory-like domain-containing protein [Bacteroidales bacterium]|nr:carboxypeptidase regulatory-like domain-containing protein [Bacteroidales bacterium]